MVPIPDVLDRYFPSRGSCMICGGPDARHRVFDTIVERHRAGDSVEFLAEDYGTTAEAIRAVLEHYVYEEAG